MRLNELQLNIRLTDDCRIAGCRCKTQAEVVQGAVVTCLHNIELCQASCEGVGHAASAIATKTTSITACVYLRQQLLVQLQAVAVPACCSLLQKHSVPAQVCCLECWPAFSCCLVQQQQSLLLLPLLLVRLRSALLACQI